MSGSFRATRCTVSRDGTTLTLAGVIDEGNRAEIADRLVSEVAAGADRLDLTAVTVFGAAGVHALLRGHRALPAGGRLRVTCGALTYRVLDMCGVLKLDGLTVTPAALDLTVIDYPTLDRARTAARDWAAHEGYPAAAAADVMVAVGEVVTNGLIHGAAPVRVRGWRAGRVLVVQVDDAGGRPLPPDAGFALRPSAPDARYGLWLARRLTESLTTHSAAGTTTVRLHFPAP
ncbi:ATP-binding protein [Dactylosporangium sp. CA-092794]|uniref:ATP-binding protein n=1 Tax=Dactylosporangium sp. CA-092794 TaxID=3239929 RepID=UPI003D8C7286